MLALRNSHGLTLLELACADTNDCYKQHGWAREHSVTVAGNYRTILNRRFPKEIGGNFFTNTS